MYLLECVFNCDPSYFHISMRYNFDRNRENLIFPPATTSISTVQVTFILLSFCQMKRVCGNVFTARRILYCLNAVDDE
jgi:hypothetical protein